jgi:hypothetical protein
MKNFILATLAIFSSFFANAQFSQIQYGDMETWTNVGAATEEPQQWNSNKTGGGNASTPGPTCSREATNPRSGTYCAKVTSISYIGQIVNGSLTTGRIEAPTFNKADGYIRSIPTYGACGNGCTPSNYGMRFEARPDSFVFWYRYTKAGSDYPKVDARLHVGYAYAPEAPNNNNHPDSTANIIARAEFIGASNSVASWTRISLPFSYVAGAAGQRMPTYIFITSTSTGNQSGGTAGSTLWLDDFEVIYNAAITTNVVSPLSYFVSSTSGTAISVPFSVNGTFNAGTTFTTQLSDASGSFTSPTNLGTLVLASAITNAWQQANTINGTIPAGTATGTGYRIRVVSNTPAITGTDNGANISINLVSNSIAPNTTQNLIANTSGAMLTVTETPTGSSREWKYTSTSGSGYTSFASAQTGTTYTPNFALGGVYYVVCQTTFPGGLVATSNEVQINVAGNSITPAAPQSTSVGIDGNLLTVNETPTGSAREWKYTTTSGSGYTSFTPAQTGLTYTPNFASAGTYYVVCQSTLNSITVTSNEVEVAVTTLDLATGTIAGSPFEFSPNAPDASVNVPYTTNTAVFVSGNIFIAQLSDASGSFAAPTNIGSVTNTVTGTIAATIPANTPAGSAYRIRVVSSDAPVVGSDNGTNLVVDQFNNSISPTSTQTLALSNNGTAINVTASQTSTHEWLFTTTSGSGYQSFNPAQTGSSYTPNFAVPGTYYVVCVSKNQYNDSVVSNEVQINVNNGTTLNTSAVSGSPYLVSPSANVQLNVPFTSNIVFSSGNIFTAQLSDRNGSFASPANIGTLSGTTIAPISATIPNNSIAGTGYRIRVISSNPAATGTDNGTNLTIVPFESNVAPSDTQNLFLNVTGIAVTVTETHPSTRNWLYSQFSGFSYNPFNPPATGTSHAPRIGSLGTYYMICRSVNSLNDTITSKEIVLIVTRDTTGIDNTQTSTIQMYNQGGNLYILRDEAKNEKFELYDMNGKLVINTRLTENKTVLDISNLTDGIYLFAIDNNRGKINIFGK